MRGSVGATVKCFAFHDIPDCWLIFGVWSQGAGAGVGVGRVLLTLPVDGGLSEE